MRTIRLTVIFIGAAATAGALAAYEPPIAARAAQTAILTTDRYVKVISTVPVMTGQAAQIFVRERATPATVAATTLNGRVVLFVHGAGTPAEVAFDVAYEDYSWMAALARAGLDVFAMDTTGYGRSTRPTPMNDPCNLSAAQQAQFVPLLLAAPCPATYSTAVTTIASDWNDISAVVDYVRALRRVERVSLIGWSLGGPRAGGFTAAHPDKVDKLVLLSPAYTRSGASAPPSAAPSGTAFNTQSRTEFDANWDRQVGCPGQFDMGARESVWSAMLLSDPVGATWGSGVRRAPQTSTWGWNRETAATLKTPLLLFSPLTDLQVLPARVKELYDDAGSSQKLIATVACASHNAAWERAHGLIFSASAEFLTRGTVNGASRGELKLENK